MTEALELLESQLSALQSHATFSTIVLRFTPFFEGRPVEHRSPFPWIRQLSPQVQSLSGGWDQARFTIPAGFVSLKESEGLSLVAADNSVIYGAVIENEPRGESAFWQRAVAYEMSGRQQLEVSRGESVDGLRWLIFKSPELRPSFYLIGLLARGDTLLVLCLLYTSPSPRDGLLSRMPSSA